MVTREMLYDLGVGVRSFERGFLVVMIERREKWLL